MSITTEKVLLLPPGLVPQ